MRVVLILIVSVVLSNSAWAGEAQALVENAAERYLAFSSGKILYTHSRNKSPSPREIYAFDGSNWTRKFPDSPGVACNFSGARYEYVELDSGESIYRRIHVKQPESINEFPGMNKPPFFAGSFWSELQPKFIKSHSSEAKLVGSKTIDGVDTRICEFKVNKAEVREAFRWVSPQLFDGGVLRLYIAPELGYAIPQIEYIGPDNQIYYTFTASDFSEYSPGLWLPEYISMKAKSLVEFRIHKYELVNQPVPDEEFLISLKAGTVVTDRINNVRHVVKEDSNTADMGRKRGHH